MTTVASTKPRIDPRRYFESVHSRDEVPEHAPVCLYLETTNRCNLLCTTCPRTYAELEPPADMSWKLFVSIVEQIPNLARAVLHGVGEPMLVKELPRMVRHLKQRGTYVLFNTNGTVLNLRNGRALIEAGLDELRVSFDASNAKSYRAIRGKDFFNRILKNVRAFRDLQEREGHDKPRVSAWLTGLRETIAELPDFVRVAAETGVKEIYLQRLVFFEEDVGKVLKRIYVALDAIEIIPALLMALMDSVVQLMFAYHNHEGKWNEKSTCSFRLYGKYMPFTCG